MAFERFAGCLSHRLTQVTVILVTVGLFAAGIYGSVLIRAGIDEKQLLPLGSYLEQFISQHYTSYPDTGWPGYVYSGTIDYSVEDLEKLDSIAEGINRHQEEGRLIKESQWTNHDFR